MPRLLAKVVASKNCFVNLPQPMINDILRQQSKNWEGRILVKLQWNTNRDGVILAWSGDRSERSEYIELGNELAGCIFLSSETDVDVTLIPSAAVHDATHVLVEPTSPDDWEILSIHAAFLEDQLMNQVAVLHNGMTLPLWINTSTIIRITVKETKPQATVKLVAGSEIVVSPKPRSKPKSESEEKDKTQSSKVRRKTRILRIQSVLEDLSTFSIFCNPKDMQNLRWVDGLLVCMNTLAPPTTPSPNSDSSHEIIKKAFARVYASENIAEGHISGHKNLLVAVLGLHRLSRLRIQPMASEDSARSISRIYLRRHKSADDSSDPALGAKSSSLSELGAALALWSAIEHGCLKRPIPMLNGSVITLYGNNYCIYFNLEFEDDTPQSQQQQQQQSNNLRGMSSSNDAMAFSQISNMLPSIPGMPDMGAIDTLRDVYNRAMDARQLSIASGSRPIKSLQEQMSSQDLFFVDPNSVKEIVQSISGPVAQRVQRFRLGDEMDFDLEAETAGMATEVPPVLTKEIGGLDKELKAAMDHVASIVSLHRLKRSLTQESSLFSRGALFIHGQHGSGKSMLANAIATHFTQIGPQYSYGLRLSCSELSGARHDTITKCIGAAFTEALLCQPSVIILDDLDVVIPNEQQDVAQSWQLSIHLNIILDYLKSLLLRIQEEKHAVAVIITAQNGNAIHESMQHPHFVRTQVVCQAPNQRARGEIFKKILESRGVSASQVDIPTIALKTEGYLGADLHQLVERAFYVASTRMIESTFAASTQILSAATTPSSSAPSSPRSTAPSSTNHVAVVSNGLANCLSSPEKHDSTEVVVPSITTKDILKAQEDFVPASLKGVTLQKSGVSWDDIGGLDEVRETLKQTLEWPTRYSFLFKSTPIRQRSGILLYGPSGCGKTLLASAIAKECGLNFISVKGPELLNKYIGASEQSVRDMFARASAAAPCILFFDEFDAIAPRRGHDNTGVTDRVVNQFLTQLDGVEVIEGVYVLAATSRPDLIDPALLRPGRLDKCLFVGLPNREERISILRALSRKMVISKNIDWEALADLTDNCTGADLQALLYNAQLEAIHSKLDHLRAKMLRMESKSSSENVHAFAQFKLADSVDAFDSLTSEQRSNVMKKVETIKENIAARSDGAAAGGPSTAQTMQHDVPVIENAHLKKAMDELVPSISAAERKRYQQIYSSFLQSRGADFQDSNAALQNQRQTLA